MHRVRWLGFVVLGGGCFPGPIAIDAGATDVGTGSDLGVDATEVREDTVAVTDAEVVGDAAVDGTGATDAPDVTDAIDDVGECKDADQCTHLAAACTKVLCLDHTCAVLPDGGASCDDGDPCTRDDTCAGFACAGTSYECGDGVACTDDRCNGAGGCDYPAADGFCHIGGTCFAVDTVDADDPCRVCSGGEAWSGNDGADCEDGDACTVGDRCVGVICEPGVAPDDAFDWNLVLADGTNAVAHGEVLADGTTVVFGSVVGSVFAAGGGVPVGGSGSHGGFLARMAADGQPPEAVTTVTETGAALVLHDDILTNPGTLAVQVPSTLVGSSILAVNGPDASFQESATYGTSSFLTRVDVDGNPASPAELRLVGVSDSASAKVFHIGGAGDCAIYAYTGGALQLPSVPLIELPAVSDTTVMSAAIVMYDSSWLAQWAQVVPILAAVAQPNRGGGCVVAGPILGNVMLPGGQLLQLDAFNSHLVAFDVNGWAEHQFVAIDWQSSDPTPLRVERRADGSWIIWIAVLDAGARVVGALGDVVDVTAETFVVASLTASGELEWARRFPYGGGSARGRVTLLDNGDTAIGVGLAQGESFDAGPDDVRQVESEDAGVDAYVLVLDRQGVLRWMRGVASGPGRQLVDDVRVGPGRALTIMGTFEGTTVLGATHQVTESATSEGIFVTRINSTSGVDCNP